MQQFNNAGPQLTIKPIEWNHDMVKEMLLYLLPQTDLFEGFGKNDTIKGCIFDGIVEMWLYYLQTKQDLLKQLNWFDADETLLPAWEKLCGITSRGVTLQDRRIEVAIRMGLTRNISDLPSLEDFIRYLGIDYIRVVHASEYYKGSFGYDYNYDSYNIEGGVILAYGLIWEVYASKPEDTKKLKEILERLAIQTAYHMFVEINL
jgi:hypothetical protein